MEARRQTAKIRRLTREKEDSPVKIWNTTKRRTNATSARSKDIYLVLVQNGNKIRKLHELQRYFTFQRKQKKHPSYALLEGKSN